MSNLLVEDLTKFIYETNSLTVNDIKELAYKDYLTKLYNRRSLFRLSTLINNDPRIHNLVFFILDIDEFKNINDFFGHTVGDLALKEVSKVLLNVCKDGYVARIAGDEFLVIYQNITDLNTIKNISKSILVKINKIAIDEPKFRGISASIGIAIGKNNEKNINKLLIKSDLALYKAKSEGKNTSIIFTPDLDDEKRLRIDVVNELINDIDNEQNVALYYQPKYTCDGNLVSFEALFRWNNPKYPNIPIYKIINVIENSKYCDYFNDYIIKTALKFSKKINKNRKEPIKISINISAKQLMDYNFESKLLGFFEKYDISPNTIGIELTETVLLQDLNKNIKKIQNLKDLGVLIYLDDFGTGYSSLNYLIKLPLSRVKIDKDFIWHSVKGDKYLAILKSIVEICHTLKLPVIAEGVETEEQLKILKDLNVDYIQGFLFSKPLDEKSVLNLLDKLNS